MQKWYILKLLWKVYSVAPSSIACHTPVMTVTGVLLTVGQKIQYCKFWLEFLKNEHTNGNLELTGCPTHPASHVDSRQLHSLIFSLEFQFFSLSLSLSHSLLWRGDLLMAFALAHNLSQ
jgi:hypothetical protein